MTARTCGGCTACCKTLSVYELEKGPNTWCEHCAIGTGCRIYRVRPASCQRFSCVWLANEWLPEPLRPDRCKVVMDAEEGRKFVVALVDPGRPGGWRRADLMAVFDIFIAEGRAVIVVSGGAIAQVLLPEGLSQGELEADLLVGAEEKIGAIAAQEGEAVGTVVARMMASGVGLGAARRSE